MREREGERERKRERLREKGRVWREGERERGERVGEGGIEERDRGER